MVGFWTRRSRRHSINWSATAIPTCRGLRKSDRRWCSIPARSTAQPSIRLRPSSFLRFGPRSLRCKNAPVLTRHAGDLLLASDRVAAAVAELHQVGVFGRVFIELAQDANCAEAAGAKEELSREIGFTHLQQDAIAAFGGKFPNELGNHLRANASAAVVRAYRKIQDVQPRFMQLVDHEADDLVVALGNHADAVPL